MSFAGIDTFTEFIVAFTALVGAVKFLVMPLRRTLSIIEANRDLYEAQLRKNGGGSLTDKTDRIYRDVFPVDGPTMREMLVDIAEQQKLNAKLVGDQHKSNTKRLDAIEADQKRMAECLKAKHEGDAA